jgi:hypothetical protein
MASTIIFLGQKLTLPFFIWCEPCPPYPICAAELWVLGDSSTGSVAFRPAEYVKYPSGVSQSLLQNGIHHYFAGTKPHLAISFGVKPCPSGPFVLS